MVSSSGVKSRQSPTSTSMPMGSARVCTTAMVWGWHRSDTKKRLRSPFTLPARRLMASAAAVPSSRREALPMSRPVRSMHMVWKFSSASRRPWAISAW